MANHDRFFEYEKQAAAVLKHAVLQRYLGAFASMLANGGSNIGFLDGYAGSGIYSTGTGSHRADGSPKIALGIADTLHARGQRMLCTFVEKDRANFESLQTVVTEAGLPGCRAISGDLAAHLGTVMEEFAGVPLLVFLDPFGTSLDSETTIEAILKRKGSEPTELLLNFSVDSVRRIGARLYQDDGSHGRDASLARLDEWLGGIWWRKTFEDAAADGGRSRATVAAEQVSTEYAKRLGKATGMGHYSIPVQRRPGHLPIFNLILFFQRSFAVPRFNDAVSKASEDWRAHIRDLDLQSAEKRDRSDPRLTGMTRVEELAEVFKGEDEAFRREAIDEIKDRITEGLVAHERLVVRSNFELIYGDALGKARETHLRTAWKELAAEGVAEEPPKGGKLDSATIRRA